MDEIRTSFVIADVNRVYPPPAPTEDIETTMVETPNGRGAWLRAWPSGHVHYSPEWYVSDDFGRMNTLCGRSRIYWPEWNWPKAKVCAACKAKVEAELAVDGVA